MGKISHSDMDNIIQFLKDNFKKRFTDDNINELIRIPNNKRMQPILFMHSSECFKNLQKF